MSAKALARQRLLKKKQMEASGQNTKKLEEDDKARKAEEARRKTEEEVEKERLREQADKLKLAKQEGAVGQLNAVFKTWTDAAVTTCIVNWVENFGEQLALEELEEDEAHAEEL